MSTQKKFGTFAGVFTPSLLTILGVILYMRLGAVVGNSGSIVTTICIILFAHVVSITTGLSVSSVATDKKIKAGGIYYMLSRSLGFPIGGAIGVTIFLATALSISLYLIGFAESILLTLQSFEWVGEITTNHLRIAGSITLLLIVVVAFISTSLAMKMQYFILMFIAASLVTIFFGNGDPKVGTDIMEDASFGVLFGIFFPAVTGFTAGVAMSGDLKNPKTSIPWGTMLSIAVGLVVYLAVALIMYFNIDMEVLASNNNAIVEYAALGGVLVVVGIWGATLSSALGGILGAPRILQAMSNDKITPRTFGKGVGVNNEPRNALVLTAVISLGGILIGELNAIAEIVAMFYMSAYFFINVSCFFEQWSSPDFRPSFKIPLAISLVGAIATLLLMIQLNLAAALVSFLIMGLLFVWLTKKDLELGSGDVWNSVWSSIVKKGLKNLQKKSTHKRNWEPNILLFSGASARREQLISVSKAIAGRNGMISNFDLIEDATAKVLFPKHQQTLALADGDETIFYRQQQCQNIYRGIENIANTYGFSGIDPNTIVMGWGRNTKNPSEFVKMTDYLTQLDHNVLFLDYDVDREFGKRKQIDVWWSHFDEYCELSLQITKLMQASVDWSQASLRVLYKNSDNSTADYVHEIIESKLENARLQAEIIVVNNELEQKSLYELVRLHSNQSDLIFLELPKFADRNEVSFIQSTNELLKDIGTTLLVRASSHFYEDLNLSPELHKEYKNIQSRLVELDATEDVSISKTNFEGLDITISEIFDKIHSSNKKISSSIYAEFEKSYAALVNVVEKSTDHGNLSIDSLKGIFEDFKERRLDNIRSAIKAGIREHLIVTQSVVQEVPEKMVINIPLENLAVEATDSKARKRAKRKLSRKGGKQVIPLKQLLGHHLEHLYLTKYEEILNILGVSGFIITNEFQKAFNQTEFKFDQLKDDLHNLFEKELSIALKESSKLTVKLCNEIVNDCLNVDIQLINDEREENFNRQGIRKLLATINAYPNHFIENQKLLTNQISLSYQAQASRQLISSELNRKEKEELPILLKSKNDEIDLIMNQAKSEELPDKYGVGLLDVMSKWQADFTLIQEDIAYQVGEEMSLIEVNSLNNFEKNQKQVKINSISMKHAFSFVIEKQFVIPFGRSLLDVFNEFNGSLSNLNKSCNLLKFARENKKQSPEALKEIEAKLVADCLSLKENITIHEQKIISEISRFRSKLSGLLNAEQIVQQSAGNNQLKGLLGKKEAEKYISRTRLGIRKLDSKINKSLTMLKDAVIQSNFESRARKIESVQNRMSSWVTQRSLSGDAKNSLPYFYQDLFTSTQDLSSEKLPYRKEELQLASIALERYQNGVEGMLLFTGESLSGKSTVMNHYVNGSFKNVLRLSASASTNKLTSIEAAISAQIGADGTLDEMVANIASGTCVVFEGLESFWSASEEGLDNLNAILQFIDGYKSKFFFIAEANLNFYQYAKNVFGLDQYLISSIMVRPLSTPQVKEIILSRHVYTGLKYIWEGNHQEDIRPRRENQLFSRITQFADGNIGAALLLWLSLIEKVENGTIFLNKIDENRSTFKLNPAMCSILNQIRLHGEINHETLKKRLPHFDLNHLEDLIKSGIVLKSTTSGLMINPYLSNAVDAQLKENNLML